MTRTPACSGSHCIVWTSRYNCFLPFVLTTVSDHSLQVSQHTDATDAEGLSEISIRYAKRFYELYSQVIANLPQVVEESSEANR